MAESPVSVTIRISGSKELSEALKLEIKDEAVVSHKGASITIELSKGEDSWATVRSKANTILRNVETVVASKKALDR